MEKAILFATNNKNKARELKELMAKAGFDFEIKTNADLDNPPQVNETGRTFVENAKLKAHQLAEFSNLPTLADDSGLCVDKLNGAPGVHSARFGGQAHNDARNNAKLLALLGGVPDAERTATFYTTMVVSMPGQFDKDLIVTGECKGKILAIPQGYDGFGYDPLFYVPKKQKTFAEMNMDEKNQISHRGNAIRAFLQAFPDWWEQFN